jgi:hypothetical protein
VIPENCKELLAPRLGLYSTGAATLLSLHAKADDKTTSIASCTYPTGSLGLLGELETADLPFPTEKNWS